MLSYSFDLKSGRAHVLLEDSAKLQQLKQMRIFDFVSFLEQPQELDYLLLQIKSDEPQHQLLVLFLRLDPVLSWGYLFYDMVILIDPHSLLYLLLSHVLELILLFQYLYYYCKPRAHLVSSKYSLFRCLVIIA